MVQYTRIFFLGIHFLLLLIAMAGATCVWPPVTTARQKKGEPLDASVFMLKPYGKPCHLWLTRARLTLDVERQRLMRQTASGVHCCRAYVVENMKRAGPQNRIHVHRVECPILPDALGDPSRDHDALFFGYWNIHLRVFFVQNVVNYLGRDMTQYPIMRQLYYVGHALTHLPASGPQCPSVLRASSASGRREKTTDVGHDDDDKDDKDDKDDTRVSCALHVPFLFDSLERAHDHLRSHTNRMYNVYSVAKLSNHHPRFVEERLCVQPSSAPNANLQIQTLVKTHERPPGAKGAQSNVLHVPVSRCPDNRNERKVTPAPMRSPPPPPPPKRAWFDVKPTGTTDLYELYRVGAPNDLVGQAMVPDYPSSRHLNSLFHNIRENGDLDLIEESEDEDEFENTCANKWLVHDTPITCEFYLHPRFQKWCPVLPKDARRFQPQGSRVPR